MEQQENVNLKVTGKSGEGEGGLKDHKDFKSDRERERGQGLVAEEGKPLVSFSYSILISCNV